MKFNTFLLFFFICLLSFAQADSTQNSLIWKIYKTGQKDTSYVFGTIHLPIKKAYEPLGEIPSIMDKVNAVYFELDYASQDMEKLGTQLLATKPEDQIKSLLNSEQYQQLHDIAKLYIGEQEKVIDYLKPMAILSLITIKMCPQDTALAMDIEYQLLANAKGKIVGGLETVHEQMDVLFNISKEKQVLALLELIQNHQNHKAEMLVLLDAYVRQDLFTLKKIIDQGFLDAIYLSQDDILTKRNVIMVDRMIKKMQTNTCLFGVGAGHLISKEGVLELLKNKGYQVVKHIN